MVKKEIIIIIIPNIAGEVILPSHRDHKNGRLKIQAAVCIQVKVRYR